MTSQQTNTSSNASEFEVAFICRLSSIIAECQLATDPAAAAKQIMDAADDCDDATFSAAQQAMELLPARGVAGAMAKLEAAELCLDVDANFVDDDDIRSARKLIAEAMRALRLVVNICSVVA